MGIPKNAHLKWTVDAKQACPTNLYVYKLAITGACGAGSIATWALAWFFFISFQNIIFKHWQNSNLKWVPKKSKWLLKEEQLAR